MSLRHSLLIVASALFCCTAAADAEPIPLSRLPGCGTETVQTRDCPDCAPVTVFVRPDYWHGLQPCLRELRNAWRASGPMTPVDLPGQPMISALVRSQILFEMNRDYTRFRVPGSDRLVSFADAFGPDLLPKAPPDRMELVNDRGLPYNGMGQSGMGYMLYDLAGTAARGGYDRSARDENLYRLLARASFRTILTDVSEGGLASWHACDKAPSRDCAWFFSVTRRNQRTVSGATLNQMLHVVRDLGLAANVLAREGWTEPFDLEGAASAGLDQLVMGADYAGPGTVPALADFVGPAGMQGAGVQGMGAQGAGVQGAWAYYGFDTTKPPEADPAYFLENPRQNCSYHIHVLDLIRQVSEWAEAQGRNARALEMIAADGSTVDRFRAAVAHADAGAPSQIDCTGQIPPR